jgi:hypothetical protein
LRRKAHRLSIEMGERVTQSNLRLISAHGNRLRGPIHR